MLYQSIVTLTITAKEISISNNTFEFAFTTLLSSDEFLPGTIVLIESLRSCKTKFDIIVMILPHIKVETRQKLSDYGVITANIDYIPNPYSSNMVAERQKFNFSKLRAWLLTDYKRVILIGMFHVFLVLISWRSRQRYNRVS